MTVTHEHFLRQIQAEPDNALHRLVYADWLEEQGDERCELLRVAVEVRGTPHVYAAGELKFSPTGPLTWKCATILEVVKIIWKGRVKHLARWLLDSRFPEVWIIGNFWGWENWRHKFQVPIPRRINDMMVSFLLACEAAKQRIPDPACRP